MSLSYEGAAHRDVRGFVMVSYSRPFITRMTEHQPLIQEGCLWRVEIAMAVLLLLMVLGAYNLFTIFT